MQNSGSKFFSLLGNFFRKPQGITFFNLPCLWRSIPMGNPVGIAPRSLISNKYQLSLTKPRDALHHGKRAANKGGRSM